MNSAQKDIIGILRLLDYDESIAYLYYNRGTTTGGFYEAMLMLSYKEHIAEVTELHLCNFIRLQIKNKKTKKSKIYKIKRYYSLELQNG